MSAEEWKKGLIDACRGHLEQVISELRETMREAQASANDYGPPKDRYDPYRNQLMRRKNMYAQQLQKSMDHIQALDLIDPGRHYEEVDFGAVVVTAAKRLFIAAPLGKVDYDGNEYFVISPHVPIYKAMQGKKAGEEYTFNQKKDQILEVR